ncbi:hypothetical protein PUN28_020280 [Cardiocondyla obscurior]|uniref:Uncharacterized protein n=1 Tax=Cardiocondyla obscurior TaxID=286306 RepID=A0AAW2E771_9HYME
MSCDPVENPCPITCPKVREQLRKAIKEFPNVTDGIFPRKKNDVKPRFPPDVISRDIRDESKQIQKPTANPTDKIIDFDEKKIDLVKGKELTEEPAVTPTESVTLMEEIDHNKEKNSVVKEVTAEILQKVPVAIDELRIIKDDINLASTTQIELESSQIEENFEPEEHMEYSEEEESITDYEKFIDEELQESLPAVIAREIPEEPRAVRREISRNAATLYERIDRERPVRLPREREAVTAMSEERPIEEEISVKRALASSTITEHTDSRKPAENVCEETCPLVKQQKGKQLSY